MKNIFCANCGKRLKLLRKALPKYATIVDLIEYHECSPEPVPFEINPTNQVNLIPVEGKDKFVQMLNELNPSRSQGFAEVHKENYGAKRSSMTGTDDLRDRRFDQHTEPTKSTAPGNVLDMIKGMQNSSPEHELKPNVEPEPESEA